MFYVEPDPLSIREQLEQEFGVELHPPGLEHSARLAQAKLNRRNRPDDELVDEYGMESHLEEV